MHPQKLKETEKESNEYWFKKQGRGQKRKTDDVVSEPNVLQRSPGCSHVKRHLWRGVHFHRSTSPKKEEEKWLVSWKGAELSISFLLAGRDTEIMGWQFSGWGSAWVYSTGPGWWDLVTEMNVSQTQNEPPSVWVYEHTPAAAQRMLGRSIQNSQKVVPDPSQTGPPCSGLAPWSFTRRLGHQPPGSWNSQAGFARGLAHTVLCKRSYLIATQNLTLGQLKYTFLLCPDSDAFRGRGQSLLLSLNTE